MSGPHGTIARAGVVVTGSRGQRRHGGSDAVVVEVGHDGGSIMHVHRVGRGLVIGRGEHARGRQEREATGRGQASLLCADGGLAV